MKSTFAKICNCCGNVICYAEKPFEIGWKFVCIKCLTKKSKKK